ncbi:O-antigen ligase family protein [Burkholderia sp. RS01]|uniref:O-antigen ligase family protein n=1 Tax=unclassified Burkholderia TaxID=2613784 RepID=UPI0032181E94
MIAMFAFAVLPTAFHNLTTVRTASQLTIEASARTHDPLSSFYVYGLVAVLAALVMASVATIRLPRTFWLYLAPWVAATIGTYASGQGISVAAFVYPILGLVIFSLPGVKQTLRTTGVLVFILATFSLATAFITPSTAFLTLGGEAKESLFTGQALAGPVSHPNTLGQMLALGLPFVLYIPSRLWRIAAIVLVPAALLATGSRTALTAAAMGLLVMILWKAKASGLTVRGLLAPLGLVIIYPVVLLASPWFIATSDPESFTGRGYIWAGSLDLWQHSPIFGNGARAFYVAAGFYNDLGVGAFHAHNELLNMLVTAGVVGLLATLVLVIALLRESWAAGSAGLIPLAVWPIVFLADGWFEAPTDFYAVAGVAWMTWIPFALVLRANESVRNAAAPITEGSTPVPAAQRRSLLVRRA